MYFFAGSNVFGQWYGCPEEVIDQFITFPEKLDNTDNFNVNNASLVHIGWSHNIFQIDKKIYITGDFKCSEQFLEVVKLPEECSKDISNITVGSDDNNLILVNKKTCTYWLINMETNDVKINKLTTEKPIGDSKKLKIEQQILKFASANNSLIFLTNEGLVYSGLLPNLVDTSQCKGDIVDVQCGFEHYILLTADGRVYTWGNGQRLQLGHGDLNSLDVPKEVEALAGIKMIKISAGGWHSLALSEYGDVYAWGWNEMGQLGIKEDSKTSPVKTYVVPSLVDIFDDNDSEVDINVIDIACGSRHSVILLEDNTIWASGSNMYGQLGLSSETYSKVNCFIKSWSPTFKCSLICGPWSTVISK